MAFNRNTFELKLGHRQWKSRELSDALRKVVPRDFMPSESAVFQWCTGKKNPSTKYLRYIAKALDCTVDDLITK